MKKQFTAMENVEIFKNTEFGEVRTLMVNNEPWFDGQGVNVTTKTTKVTGKGQLYFVNKFLSGGFGKAE